MTLLLTCGRCIRQLHRGGGQQKHVEPEQRQDRERQDAPAARAELRLPVVRQLHVCSEEVELAEAPYDVVCPIPKVTQPSEGLRLAGFLMPVHARH